jgi:hypothetical protein
MEKINHIRTHFAQWLGHGHFVELQVGRNHLGIWLEKNEACSRIPGTRHHPYGLIPLQFGVLTSSTYLQDEAGAVVEVPHDIDDDISGPGCR